MQPTDQLDWLDKDEIEKLLADVTSPGDPREIVFRPDIFSGVMSHYSTRFIELLRTEHYTDTLLWNQLDRIRDLVLVRFTGQRLECMLLTLYSSASFREIGRRLDICKDTVRREVQRAMKEITETLTHRTDGFEPNTNNGVTTQVLPLDTVADRKALDAIIANNQIQHLAFSGSGDHREVLLVYTQHQGAHTRVD